MTEPFSAILKNKVFWIGFSGWAVAQSIKILLGVVRERRFDFKWILGTGGMPSTHASGVAALAVSVGLKEGWTSTIFAVAAIFAFVIMFDAQGVRRSAGKQASILNKMIDELYLQGRVSEERLWELVGHTPFEVFVGAVIGALTAMAIAARFGV